MNQNSKNYALTEDKILKENELKIILKAIRPYKEMAERTKKQIHNINDYYLIWFGSLVGLRASEIASLKIKDLNQSSIVVIGKGSKKRIIPLGRRGRKVIAEYIKHKESVLQQSTEPNQYLFCNRSGKPFSRFTVNRRFRHWIKKCPVNQTLSWHSIRHFFATYLLNNGFLIHEVQLILGHSSVVTTSIYLHFSQQTMERVDAAL